MFSPQNAVQDISKGWLSLKSGSCLSVQLVVVLLWRMSFICSAGSVTWAELRVSLTLGPSVNQSGRGWWLWRFYKVAVEEGVARR